MDIAMLTMNYPHFHSKKVAITGGLGFIGSHLAKALVDNGAQVTIIDSLIPQYGGNLFNVSKFAQDITINISDVRDSHSLKYLLSGQHYLFNLAGQTSHLDSMLDPKTDLDINAAAQLSIVEACRLHNPDIKIIFASTRQIYGKPQFLPVTETHPIHPVDINGIHKWAGESYHSLYQEVYGLQACSLRLTNTYGPHMRIRDARQTFLGVWFKQLLEGKPIQVFGDGMQLRDFNYVDDVVEAFLIAAQDSRSNGKVFNLGGNEIINLRDLAEKVVALKEGASFELIPFPPERKAIDIGDYYGSSQLIELTLGWSPKVLLNEGLKNTYSYYEQYHSEYLK